MGHEVHSIAIILLEAVKTHTPSRATISLRNTFLRTVDSLEVICVWPMAGSSREHPLSLGRADVIVEISGHGCEVIVVVHDIVR
jgi:hypothetical protein